MYKREAKALEGEMCAKRKAGRAKLTTDWFGKARNQIAQRKSTAYMAAAEAAAKAEAAAEKARARLWSNREESDSDAELSVEPQEKPPAKKRQRKGQK